MQVRAAFARVIISHVHGARLPEKARRGVRMLAHACTWSHIVCPHFMLTQAGTRSGACALSLDGAALEKACAGVCAHKHLPTHLHAA